MRSIIAAILMTAGVEPSSFIKIVGAWLASSSNREFILFLISGAAFIMSLSTWIFALIHNRRKIRVVINEYFQYPTYTILHMTFENLSRLPISISRVSMPLGGTEYNCRVRAKMVFRIKHSKGGVETGEDVTNNLSMPIAISALGAISGFICFEHPEQASIELSTPSIFRFYTNRGRVIETSLPLGRALHSREFL